MCHLIYPASTPWYEASDTCLLLHDGEGTEIAAQTVNIPCGGSLNWRYHDVFDAADRRRAGERPYVIIRDVTCRLFGYHGVINKSGSFSQSAVSRQLDALEKSLDTPLFHRHARGLLLTEQGELLFRTVHEVFHILAMAESQLAERHERALRPLKVTTSVALHTGAPRQPDLIQR